MTSGSSSTNSKVCRESDTRAVYAQTRRAPSFHPPSASRAPSRPTVQGLNALTLYVCSGSMRH